MSRRLKVLVQAYACNPNYGSEEGVGWGWVTAIAKHHDLHVLTAAFHRSDIDAVLEKDPQLRDAVTVHYVPHRAWHYHPTPIWKWIEASLAKPIMHMAYRSWQRAAYEHAVDLSRTEAFDLVHVMTYVGFRFPGKFWKMPIPLIWGPIGGLENTPWRYFGVFSAAGVIKYTGRNFINTMHKLLLISPKKAFRKAGDGGVIAATSAIRDEIRRWYGVESVVRCEIGTVGQPDQVQISGRAEGEPLRIVWSGIHEDRKALPLLLEALARLPDTVNWSLTVLGTGPLTHRWQEIAARLGVADRVTWAGRISRDAAVARMAQSHVMVVTSVYDLTSTVIIEALCVGLPVICPDHYGFSDAIDDTCGFKVPTTSLDDISAGIADALQQMHGDETNRRQMARGALQRAKHYGWEETGRLVSRIYEAKAR